MPTSKQVEIVFKNDQMSRISAPVLAFQDGNDRYATEKFFVEKIPYSDAVIRANKGEMLTVVVQINGAKIFEFERKL